jgi:glycosyltransferase involved in cell wall biosynthesis
MFRLAYIVTHPIQYQAPLLRYIATGGEFDLDVFFLSDFSLHVHHEKAFNRTFQWDVPMTEGYSWELLPRWGIGPSNGMLSWWPARSIKQKLKRGNFDAVWVHGWGHIGLRQAIRAAHALALPVLLRGESKPDSQPNRTLRGWLRHAFCHRLFRRVGGYLCIGSLNREFYRGFGVPEEKLFSMPYAVDNEWFRTRSSEATARREAFRKETGLEPGRPVILFAAKFIPVKAPGDLLEAYKQAWSGKRPGVVASPPQAKKDGVKPYLLFVGDGPLRGVLEAQAGALKGSDVRFLGFKNQTELPALYDLCDVFVLPSVHEPWGLVVNEVMNAAKPVIVSDRVGAAPDLVEDGINGFTYQSGDVVALAMKLKKILESPQTEREKMGQRSLERINTWDFTADRDGLLTALSFVYLKRHQGGIAI